jgi:hypothetical protein
VESVAAISRRSATAQLLAATGAGFRTVIFNGFSSALGESWRWVFAKSRKIEKPIAEYVAITALGSQRN